MPYSVSQPSTLTHIGISDDPPNPSSLVLTPMFHVHMTLCVPMITPRGSHDPIQSSLHGYIVQSPLVIVCPPFPVQTWSVHLSSLVYIAVGVVLYFLDLISQDFLWIPVPPYCQGTCENSFTAQLVFLEQLPWWLLLSSSTPPCLINYISDWRIEPRDRWLPSLIFGMCVCQALSIGSDAWPAWGIRSHPDRL